MVIWGYENNMENYRHLWGEFVNIGYEENEIFTYVEVCYIDVFGKQKKEHYKLPFRAEFLTEKVSELEYKKIKYDAHTIERDEMRINAVDLEGETTNDLIMKLDNYYKHAS